MVEKGRIKILIRNFIMEVVIYAALVIAYFFLVLRFLAEPLKELFSSNLVVYAFASLGLIVVQGAVLEFVTSFLLRRLGVDLE
jgi:hypothetical protein